MTISIYLCYTLPRNSKKWTVWEMKKDTSELLKELENCSDFRAFYSDNSAVLLNTSLSEQLNMLLEKYCIKKAEAIKRSELSEIYAYQIFSGVRVPERKKLLSLAIGMGISFSEVQLLLRSCSYAPLYVKNEFDCIIIYGIIKHMSVIEINELLFEFGFETLG